jgi:histidine decarboxylase
MRLFPQRVGTDGQGRIDLKLLRECLHYNRPVVLVLNCGTHFSGAVDDIDGAVEVLNRGRMPYHVHVDAALGGLLPFAAGELFKHGIHSASVSGHKMPGCPIPCGVYLSRQVQAPTVDYIGSRDATALGSRPGWSALALWLALQHHGREGFARMARDCMMRADGLWIKLFGMDYPCRRADHSIMVVLRKPGEALCKKWQLACEGEWAHVVAMPHVTDEMLDEFVGDLKGEQR